MADKRARRAPLIAVIIIIIAAAALVSISASLYTHKEPSSFVTDRTVEQKQDLLFSYEIVRYPAAIALADTNTGNVTLGVNVETNNIDFGVIPFQGGKSTKQINLTSKDGAHYVELRAFGSIRELVTFDDNNFIFSDKKGVSISASSNGIAGNYTGEIDVIIKRSHYSFTKGIFGY